ncbi:calexcitin-2-like [Planococcus citri]|uniref:calexcitin-2-like n=1 Tax=Planococcus citri TaxID=170843 RepID=UPI0031F9B767
MSEPPSPRSTLTIHHKHHRNASFSVRSDTSDDVDKSARKFFTTWRTACDRTKDKTRELLKRTLSWKGQDYSVTNDLNTCMEDTNMSTNTTSQRGWSVHIWTTWVRRSSLGDDEETPKPINLSDIQKEKFSHFFTNLLDLDRDELISIQDFDYLAEKLRHFADWSHSGTEFSLLKQVQQEFINTFFVNVNKESPISCYIELDDWLRTWSNLLTGVVGMRDLPFWLQQFPKVLFLVINKSGNGILSKEELKTFFASIIGYHDMNEEDLNEMYKTLTANGDFPLKFHVYELCFANWLFCKNPNGPGQWLFGKCGARPDTFPIDYSALCAPPEEREPYVPDKKSNRHSIIV